MMVYFRERINMNFIKKINQKMVRYFLEKTEEIEIEIETETEEKKKKKRK